MQKPTLKKCAHQGTQTDPAVSAKQEPQNPKIVDKVQAMLKSLPDNIPKLKSIIEQEYTQLLVEVERNQKLTDRVEQLLSELSVKDAALKIDKHGKSIADVLADVTQRINSNVKFKFEKYRSHIEELQNVVDQNAKVVKELTETLQTKNEERLALMSEDKIKQGRIENLQRQLSSNEQTIKELRNRETELMMHQASSLTVLPELQATAERAIIGRLYQQITALRVDAIKAQDEGQRVSNQLQLQTSELQEAKAQVEALKANSESSARVDAQILRQVHISGQNDLKTIVSDINRALKQLEAHTLTEDYRSQTIKFFEKRCQDLTDSYESLLLQHLQLQHKAAVDSSELIALKALQTSDGISQAIEYDALRMQLNHLQAYCDEQSKLSRGLRLRQNELEEELTKYKKQVLLDESSYPRMLAANTLQKSETKIIQFILSQHDLGHIKRLETILDLVLKHNIHLEFELCRNNSERLKNDHHLPPQQREYELRQKLVTPAQLLSGDYGFTGAIANQQSNLIKLESHISRVKGEILLYEAARKNQPHQQNENLQLVIQLKEELAQVRQLISTARAEAPRESKPQTLPKQDSDVPMLPQIKKAQGMQIIETEGRKPRFINDYNKPVRLGPHWSRVEESLTIIDNRLACLEQQLSRNQARRADGTFIDMSQAEQAQIGAILQEVDILSKALECRQHEAKSAILALQKVIFDKSELQNTLILKDLVIDGQGGVTDKTKADEMFQRVQNLVKANNFIKKRDIEARKELDAKKHECDQLRSELLATQQATQKLKQELKQAHPAVGLSQKAHRMLNESTEKMNDSMRTDSTRKGFNGKPAIDEKGNTTMTELTIKRAQAGKINQTSSTIQVEGKDRLKRQSSRESSFMLQKSSKPPRQKAESPHGTSLDGEVRRLAKIVETLTTQNQQLELAANQTFHKNVKQSKLLSDDRKLSGLMATISQKLEMITGLLQSEFDSSSQGNQGLFMSNIWAEDSSESVFAKVQRLLECIKLWEEKISYQISASQKMFGTESQQPTEREQKLEKLCSIYQARIETQLQLLKSKGLYGALSFKATKPTSDERDHTIQNLFLVVRLKDALIELQEAEIIKVRQTVETKTSYDLKKENWMLLTDDEAKALREIRQLGMQSKLLGQFEKSQKINSNDEIGWSLEALMNKCELVQILMAGEQKIGEGSTLFGRESTLIELRRSPEEIGLSEHQIDLHEWMGQVKDVMATRHNNQAKLKLYQEALESEMPILLMIQQKNTTEETQARLTQIEKNTESLSKNASAVLKAVYETQPETKENESQTLVDFLREKNARLVAMVTNQQPVANAGITQTDQQALQRQIAQLMLQNETLKERLSVAEDIVLREQTLYQDLEQALIASQKQLIEKEGESIRQIRVLVDKLQSAHRDELVEYIMQGTERLNHEATILKESLWQTQRKADQLKSEVVACTKREKQLEAEKEQLQAKIRELVEVNECLKMSKIQENLTMGEAAVSYQRQISDLRVQRIFDEQKLGKLESLVEQAEQRVRVVEAKERVASERLFKSDYELRRATAELAVHQQTQQVYIQYILALRQDLPLSTAVSRILTVTKALQSTIVGCQRQRDFLITRLEKCELAREKVEVKQKQADAEADYHRRVAACHLSNLTRCQHQSRLLRSTNQMLQHQLNSIYKEQGRGEVCYDDTAGEDLNSIEHLQVQVFNLQSLLRKQILAQEILTHQLSCMEETVRRQSEVAGRQLVELHSLRLQNVTLSRLSLATLGQTTKVDNSLSTELFSHEVELLKADNKVLQEHIAELQTTAQGDHLGRYGINVEVSFDPALAAVDKQTINELQSQVQSLTFVVEHALKAEMPWQAPERPRSSIPGSEEIQIASLQSEYQKLEQKYRQMHRQLDLLQSTIKTKDQQIQQLGQLLGSGGRELQPTEAKCKCRAELDQLWQKFSQLSEINSRLIKQANSSDGDTKAEQMELLKWQVSKVNQLAIEKDARIAKLEASQQEWRQTEEFRFLAESNYVEEIAQLKEQLAAVVSVQGQDQPPNVAVNQFAIDQLLQVKEINQLRAEKVKAVQESSRRQYEVQSSREHVLRLSEALDRSLKNEVSLKAEMAKVKNQLLEKDLASVVSKQPVMGKEGSKEVRTQIEQLQSECQRVKKLGDDLVVQREVALKTEFKNVELEQTCANLAAKIDELESTIADLRLADRERDPASTLAPKHRQAIKSNLQLQWRLAFVTHRNSYLEGQVTALLAVQEKYLDQVKTHHRLHSEIALLRKELEDNNRMQNSLEARKDIQFFDQMKERFLTTLVLHVDENKELHRKVAQMAAIEKSQREQIMRLKLQADSYREDAIASHKAYIQLQDYKLTHQDGKEPELRLIAALSRLSYLERVVAAQMIALKKLEKDTFREVERATQASNEAAELRCQLSKSKDQVAFMWDRLDFQQRLDMLLSAKINPSLQQLVKTYRQELESIRKAIK